MSNSKLHLATLSLSILSATSLGACLAHQGGSADPISSQESAVTTEAVEGIVVTMAPITSTSPAAVAEAYRQAFIDGVQSCTTVETDNARFVTVTFACAGPLATTGTLSLELTSATAVEATADLTIGGVAIDGALRLTVPASPTTARTLEGDLVVAGPRRSLDASAQASWLVSGSCVTYSASGDVSVAGISRSGARSFQVDDRTVCR